MTGRTGRLILPALASTCCAAAPVADGLIGHWGGDRAVLVVHEQNAQLTLDCGGGSFAVPTTIDRHGNFTAQGIWEAPHPGPTLVDEQAQAAPAARYSGHLVGDRLTLRVTMAASAVDQRFLLTRNRRVKLVRCL